MKGLGLAVGLALVVVLPAAGQAPVAARLRILGDAKPGALLIVQAPRGTSLLLADGAEVPAAPDGRYLVGLGGMRPAR